MSGHQDQPVETKKDRLQRELTKERTYVVSVATTFVGRFSHFEEKNGQNVAVFITAGVTDKGQTPYRRVILDRVVSAQPVPE